VRRILLAGTIAASAWAGSPPALAASRAPRTRAAHHAVAPRHRAPAASASACSDGALMPTAYNLALIRAALLCLVNRERSAHGEPPLRLNSALQRAAQSHTMSMVFGNYFEHNGPGGETPLSRMLRAGYPSGNPMGFVVGENISWGTGEMATPGSVVARWMRSPGHRENILEARYRESAFGVSPRLPASLAGAQHGAIYTEDFGGTFG
jgi:uncharacterized protein YkwD